MQAVSGKPKTVLWQWAHRWGPESSGHVELERGRLHTGRGSRQRYGVLFKILPRPFLAVSPPNREGKKTCKYIPWGKRTAQISLEERLYYGWFTIHQKKLGYCRGISYQCSLSLQSPKQKEIASKWNKKSGSYLPFPQPGKVFLPNLLHPSRPKGNFFLIPVPTPPGRPNPSTLLYSHF